MKEINEKLGLEVIPNEYLYLQYLSDWKISKEDLRRWILALESGDYKKGRGKLCSKDEEYCCLGLQAKLEGKLIKNNDSIFVFCGDKDDINNCSQVILLGHSKISEAGGLPFLVYFKDCDLRFSTLVGLNDCEYTTFEHVAWALKVLYWKLFNEEYE